MACFLFFSPLQDCWTHVNAKKGFLPKLWALLKEGGKGMAKALHPNLMPLLSKLPQVVTHPSLDFYSTFFTSFIQGWHTCFILADIGWTFSFCWPWLSQLQSVTLGVLVSQSVKWASSIQPLRELCHRHFCGRVFEVLHSAPCRRRRRSGEIEDHVDITEGVLISLFRTFPIVPDFLQLFILLVLFIFYLIFL